MISKLLKLFVLTAFCAVPFTSAVAEDKAAAEPSKAPAAEAMKASADGKVKVTFSYTPSRREKGAGKPKEVYLAGEMNNWDAYATELIKGDDGVFRVTLELKPGPILWKFLLDGNWIQDMTPYESQISPKPDRYVNDPYGGKNAQSDIK